MLFGTLAAYTDAIIALNKLGNSVSPHCPTPGSNFEITLLVFGSAIVILAIIQKLRKMRLAL